MRITKADIKRFRSLKQRKFREEERLFVAEGRKCVTSLFDRFREGYVVVRTGAEAIDVPQGMQLLEASPQEMEQLSQLQTPPDVLGVFAIPEDDWNEEYMLRLAGHELVLVSDEIQDPGNLGTIIRTADWFGVRHIVCSHTTADVYNLKVVQATMGSLARVNVHYADIESFVRKAKEQSIPVYGTLLDGTNIYESRLTDYGVLVMGNEGRGISEAVRRCVTSSLRIPSFPKGVPTAESLNVSVATAVVLAEFRKPLR